MQENVKTYYYFVENFRAVAIIFVMLSHMHFLVATSLPKQFFFIITNATTFFVFISGFLFFWTERNRFKYIHYLKRKAKVVVIPYFLISIPNIIWALYRQKNEILGLDIIQYSLWSLIVGGAVAAQLWFVPMITIFFILTPIFIRIGRLDNKNIVFIFALVLVLLSIFSTRPIENLNPFLAAFHFSGFYALGILIAVCYDRFIKLQNLIACLGFLMFFSSLYFIPIQNSQPSFVESFGILNWQMLGKLGLNLGLFSFFSISLNQSNALLGYIAKISFGLFFVHVNCNFAINYILNEYFKMESDYLFIIIEIVLTFICSIVVVETIKRVTRERSQYVIGC